MIIFGTTGVKTTIKEGNFHCPQCNTQTKYRHRKVNKFFTLYFIPLIPLGSAGEFVECRCCKGTFVPRVLENRRPAATAPRQQAPSLNLLERAFAESNR